MINLFHINNYTIDTSKFSNLLHDSIVQEFECAFAEYVGASTHAPLIVRPAFYSYRF